MTRPIATLIAILFAAGALAALALRAPPVVSARAPATAFSAARAFPDIAAIAQRPHPIGSADSARVRAHLLARMTALGLAPSVRPGPVANVVGILPGRDPGAPALVLMSHYDSTPHGPGAADDASGVAAALEIVRALQAAGAHGRDVMVVVTDGEEAGLLGAKAFFASDPLAARVGVVINMEARGDRGRVVMFETHRQAGAMIALLGDAGALSGASSLMPDLYRRLPNDTDLTVALQAGRQGLNFAFFDGQAAYHAARDTPGNLDLGSVQHLGDQTLAAALVLADAPALPARAPDLVYGDLLGRTVVAYPPWGGWLVLGVAAILGALALTRARRAGPLPWLEIGRGAVGFVLLAAVVAFVVSAAGMAVSAGPRDFRALLASAPQLLGGYSFLALGSGLAVLMALGRSKGRWRETRPLGLWFGALAVGLAAAALAQIAAPMDAFMLAWPVLAAAVMALAMQALPQQRLGAFIAVVIGVLATAQVAYWTGLMFALVGVALPQVVALFTAIGAVVLMPFAARAATQRGGALLAAGLEVVGVALLIAAVL